MKTISYSFIFLVIFYAATALAEEQTFTVPTAEGQVTLPLEVYQQLLEQSRIKPTEIPAAYAIGQSNLDIRFQQKDGRYNARIISTIELETFKEDWLLIRLLGPGAALESASLNQQPVQLVQQTDGLYWLSETKQKATLQLVYYVETYVSQDSYVTSLPIPKSAASQFEINVPLKKIDLSIAPASNIEKTENQNGTSSRGSIPAVDTMMISWRTASKSPYVISRANYTGELRGESLLWHAEYQIDLNQEAEISIPLLPVSMTLTEVEIDGQKAIVRPEDQHFVTQMSGQGTHQLKLSFQTPISYPNGVPSTALSLPEIPIARFQLDLPGEKLIQVTPHSNVEATIADGQTSAVFFSSLHPNVQLRWTEAIPEDVSVEQRANASVYQAFHAEEGVLYAKAMIQYEITRGETASLDFTIPSVAQVNRINSQSAEIADWITIESDQPEVKHIRVFLNRSIDGAFNLEVDYEQLLSAQIESFNVPLLRAAQVSRQKGMLALTTSDELALQPGTQTEMAEVGENALPAFFRNAFERTVSHTYKYHNVLAELQVKPVVPERIQGKFNTQIDSLVSISEVTLKGQVTIENDIKSGVLQNLQLQLPADINVLGLSGPSIRNHQITTEGTSQRVDIEFTREMDGLFRLELNYERILSDGTSEIDIPQIKVIGADVEHGRIAVEALSALEVRPAKSSQLSSLEINELPKHLLLKTTNPILLAYKYVRAENPFELALNITRHQEIDLQLAAIDSAHYKTLFTTDGLAVTRAQYQVRNSRRQFLRLGLNGDTDIWSVFVNGQAQKPALTDETDGTSQQQLLIKMVNSATPFTVDLVYASKLPSMGVIGRLSSALPKPDIIVTNSFWDVFIPSEPNYSGLQTNMKLVADRLVEETTGLFESHDRIANTPQALQIKLPTQGKLFQFSKLYANQAGQDAFFSIRYSNTQAKGLGLWISVAGVIAFWAGIALLMKSTTRRNGLSLIVGGAVCALAPIVLLGSSAFIPSAVALGFGLLFGVVLVYQHFILFRQRRLSQTE